MKSKFQHFISIPQLIAFVSALLPAVCQAGIIGVDASGNAQPAAINNGPNTIVANGGTSSNPFISILAGIELSGDIAQPAVIDISAGNYTVTNAGKLIGANHKGIQSTFGFDLTNSGVISGRNGDGVSAWDSASVINSGQITGSNAGVWLNHDASVTNYSIGNITGNSIGLRVSDDSTINNYGFIDGKVGVGVEAGSNATFNLINTGRITGSEGVAINGGGGANLINLYNGSHINGGICLMTGADAISMTTDYFYYVNPPFVYNSYFASDCIVNGSIDGGAGVDVLTFGKGKIQASGSIVAIGNSASNEVRGDVINMENIIKNDAGTAFIGEVGGPLRTVQTDAIHVNSGGLYVNGDIDGTQASQTTITNQGGQIGGTGTWDANIALAGASKISPGQTALEIAESYGTKKKTDSIGVLTVTSNVTLGATAAYEWNVAPGGASDLIILTGVGNAFITNRSTFMIAPTHVHQPLQDGSRVVVDTQAPLSGVFGNIRLAFVPDSSVPLYYATFVANQINPILTENFSTLRKINSDQDWELSIIHDYSQFGTTKNQVAAGRMLNQLVSSATGNTADLLAALDYSDAQTTTNTLSSLDPGAYLSTVSALTTQNYHLHRTVEAHNAVVRDDSIAVIRPASASSSKGEVSTAPDAAACAGRSNVWGSVSYDWNDIGNSNRSVDQTGDTSSFTVGIDYRIRENLRLGIVALGSQTGWHGENSLDSSVDSFNSAVYSNWGAATGWFVDALLGYNTHEFDQSRAIFMGNLHQISSARYDAGGWQGLVSGGYAAQTAAGLISPFMAIEWQQLSADSHEASGPIPVDVGSADIDSFRSLMGVKWEAPLANKVKGYASTTYAHEFVGDSTATVGFGAGSYTAKAAGLGDSVLVSAGVCWKIMPCATADFGYRGEFAMEDEGVNSNGVNIGLNCSF